MFRRVLHSLLIALACLLLAGMAAIFTREATKVAAWWNSGVAGSTLQPVNDSLIVFLQVDATDFIGSVPRSGDTLSSVNDTLRLAQAVLAEVDRPAPPGRLLALRWQGAQGEGRSLLRLRPPHAMERLSYLVLFILRTCVAAGFVVVGLWAALRRPDSPGVRALLLFSFSMASFMIAAVIVLNGSYAAFDIPFLSLWHGIFTVLGLSFSAFWLHLLLLFPRPLSLFKGRHWPIYLVCYAPFAVVQALQLLPGPPRAWTAVLLFGAMTLQVLAGLGRLWWCVTHARTPLERRQGALVLLGSGTGMGLLLALILLLNLARAQVALWPQSLVLWLICLVFLVVLLSPLSTAWAFGRYRLLEVEGRLRRGTRLALASTGLLICLVAGLYALGWWVVYLAKLSRPSAVLLLALALGVAVLPLQRRLMARLERWIYPGRRQLDDMLEEFRAHLVAMPDRASLWRELQQQLEREMGTTSLTPVLPVDGGSASALDGQLAPFAAGDSFMALSAALRAPQPLDELLASRRLVLTAEERDWLRARQAALLLPLRSAGGMGGVLVVGARQDGEDYSAEELRALATLADQAALAAENLRLLEENLQKRRLDEQLAMARRIQERFLPTALPPTPALELRARSVFCLEVAGDYYDVMPLPDGRTVLAVGDVSGKGAGAAMLMANLQASLRTAVRAGGRLEEIVAGINQLICANTWDEQFITFFVGVFDPRTGRFFYVNAGHNPPLVARVDGRLERLHATGLLLGVLPEATYSRAELVLVEGDLLVLYTDGVSEALDAREEEFGEARLVRLAQEGRQGDVGQLVAAIEEAVVAFQGRSSFADDFTLLVGRVGALLGEGQDLHQAVTERDQREA